ncbi:FAD:protein FMN transferase [Acidovorax sp. FG27]|uniref:FAD:protein FMN transferase n=1 Tax=Acidovorax sp. FG27 TaxID=3133652 RepID=UPI003340B531
MQAASRATAVSFVQAAAAASLRSADPATLQTLSGQTMGTTWSVRLVNAAFAPLAPVRSAIEAALATVVAQMSHWEPGSDLSRFNRAAPGTRHRLAPEFFTVLQAACAWAQASGGALDPTIGPLVDAWGFGAHGTPHVPDAAQRRAAAALVGFGRLELDAATRSALQPGGVGLNLSGIAKGFAVDHVHRCLQALGFADVLVEVGGELRASGARPGGAPWRVAVADPADGPPRALALADSAIATSGDRWHAFEHADRRYAHTLDPRTGEPVRHGLASVTVLHADCMQADALATVITVLGPHEGMAFAERHGLAALVCERTARGPVWAATAAFRAQVPWA